MLEAHHIQIKRKNRIVLEIAKVAVKPGELLILLGPNGAGKSTLLNTLCGDLISAHANASVLLNGKLLKDYSLNERALQLVVLPQKSDIPFPLSVLEVVLLGRTPHDSTHTENERIAKECLAEMDMNGSESKFYSELSGGEQQRVQLARIFAQLHSEHSKPKYLLLDEPVSALDLAHQHMLLRYLRELTSKNIGIILTVHDLNLAMQYADRVILLDAGKEEGNGIPEAILTAENIQKIFNLPVSLQTMEGSKKPFIVAKSVCLKV